MSDKGIYNGDNFCHAFLCDYLSAPTSSSNIQERGAFTSRLCGGDQPKENKGTNPELIAAIARIWAKEALEGVVPKTPPEHLKAKAANITLEEPRQ